MQCDTAAPPRDDVTGDGVPSMHSKALRKEALKRAIRDRSGKSSTQPETLQEPNDISDGATNKAEDQKVILHKLYSVTVKKDGDVVTKTAPRIRRSQGEILVLLEPLNIPVARHLGFEQLEGDMCCLRQSFIAGETLDKAWPDMTSEQKQNAALQIRAIIDTFRGLTPQSQVIQSVDEGPAWWLRGMYDVHGGPFYDEASFNQRAYEIFDKAPAPVKRALKDFMPTGHRIVLAHGDLAQRNFLITNKETITGLIDWEYAGWFPEYWDYVKFFDNPTEHSDWKDLADIIFSEHYDHELACYQACRRWQFP